MGLHLCQGSLVLGLGRVFHLEPQIPPSKIHLFNCITQPIQSIPNHPIPDNATQVEPVAVKRPPPGQTASSGRADDEAVASDSSDWRLAAAHAAAGGVVSGCVGGGKHEDAAATPAGRAIRADAAQPPRVVPGWIAFDRKV